jgi:hypothetical protein
MPTLAPSTPTRFGVEALVVFDEKTVPARTKTELAGPSVEWQTVQGCPAR